VSSVNNKVPLERLREWNKLSNDNVAAGKKLIIGFLVSNSTASAAPQQTEKKQAVAAETDEKSDVKTMREPEKAVTKTETKKDEPAKPVPPREDSPKTIVNDKSEVNTLISGQGYFKSSFDEQTKSRPISKTETVTSGIFKMLSGGQEAKYYMLIVDVPSGTIVRIINPDNNKTVYAKVLGEMNGIRQNQGLNIRISNSAAVTLGITDTEKFIVKINY
jgi:LysM repeat protein